MPAITTGKTEARKSARLTALDELDRVTLVSAVSDKGMTLDPGLQGTVVLCHGSEAYEVEFDGIDDFFQISAKDLAKI
jgi:hypothetical protein